MTTSVIPTNCTLMVNKWSQEHGLETTPRTPSDQVAWRLLIVVDCCCEGGVMILGQDQDEIRGGYNPRQVNINLNKARCPVQSSDNFLLFVTNC